MPSDPLTFSEEVISEIYSNNNPDCNFIFNDTLNSSNTKITSKSNSNFHSKHFSSPNESPAATANDMVDSNTDKTPLNAELSQTLALFTTIMSRYKTSIKSINLLFSKIQSLPTNGFILLNNLLKSVNASNRPVALERAQMIEELLEAGIIIISKGVNKNSIKVQKGPSFGQ